MLRLTIFACVLLSCGSERESVGADAAANNNDANQLPDARVSTEAMALSECGDSLEAFQCIANEEVCYFARASDVECREPLEGFVECEDVLTCDCVGYNLAQRCIEVGEGALILVWIGP